MKRRSASLDELWEEIKYAHEHRNIPLPRFWLMAYRAIHALFCWKAARS